MKATCAKTICIGILLSCGLLKAGSFVETTEIGDPGNPGDTVDCPVIVGGCENPGTVDYSYYISLNEVTNAEYTQFLNAVAKSDPNGLYNLEMYSSPYGGISVKGFDENYSYQAKTGMEDRPVNFVSYWDALRFANWLTNGQPVGSQAVGTTETGTYDLTSLETGESMPVVRQPDFLEGNFVAVANYNEWHKAAYYDPEENAGSGMYASYPCQSDAVPDNDLTDPGLSNKANYFDESSECAQLTGVGHFYSSFSYYGTYDQGGSVWEWNEAFNGTGEAMIRGGSFADGSDWLESSAYQFMSPDEESPYVGFRVVSNAPVISKWEDPTQVSFILLGHLEGGGSDSRPTAVSGDGSIIIGTSEVSNREQHFLWNDGDIAPLSDQHFRGYAISDDGNTVIGLYGNTGVKIVDGSQIILSYTGDGKFRPVSVSFDGSVIVGMIEVNNNSQAAIWQEDETKALVNPTGLENCYATGVSGDGSTVIGLASRIFSGSQSLVWEGEQVIQLEEAYAQLLDVSHDGSVMVGLYNQDAAVWKDKVYSMLPRLEEDRSSNRALAVSGDGRVIVGLCSSSDGDKAVVWAESRNYVPFTLNSFLDDLGIDRLGYDLVEATDVSADGKTIVGYAYQRFGSGPASYLVAVGFRIHIPEL